MRRRATTAPNLPELDVVEIDYFVIAITSAEAGDWYWNSVASYMCG
jgi:hypothetical protein